MASVAKGVTVIDDSYNSSPSALLRSLEVIARSWGTRRIAVIGEMLELGDLSESLHQDCGRAAANSRLARLITVGGEPARAMGEAAIESGMRARGDAFRERPRSGDGHAAQSRPGRRLVKGRAGTRRTCGSA